MSARPTSSGAGALGGGPLPLLEGPSRSRRLALLCLAGAAASLLVSWGACAETLTDWDSWDYAALAVERQPSHLGLWRWWFIALMRWAWQIGSAVGVDRLHAYVPMKVCVALASAGAVAGLIYWVGRFTGNLLAAAMAGLIALVSPTLTAYSSAVMTEGPSLLFQVLAMIGWEAAVRPSRRRRNVAWPSRPCVQRASRPWRTAENAGAGRLCGARGDVVHRGRAASAGGGELGTHLWAGLWAFLAGLAFGVSINMREPNLFLCAWPVVSCFLDRPARRWRLLASAVAGTALTLGLGVWMAGVWQSDPSRMEVLRQYQFYMKEERITRGFSPAGNFVYLWAHALTAAPLGVLFIGLAIPLRLARRHQAARLAQADGASQAGRAAQGAGAPHDAGAPDRLPLRRACWAAISVLPLAAFTWYNPDLSFNWRLMLPPVWMLMPLMGLLAAEVVAGLDRRLRQSVRWGPALTAASLLCCSILVWQIAYVARYQWHVAYAQHQAELFRSLLVLPDRAVVVPGPASTAAQYLMRVGLRPDWVVFHTDDHWTGPGLTGRIARQMEEGRRAFLYAPENGWRRSGDSQPEWDAVRFVLASFPNRPADGAYLELLPPARASSASSLPATASLATSRPEDRESVRPEDRTTGRP
jgi:hypothetical protein